ncbi:MAG: nicotinate-nucleotide diphosphorylase (carboxylating) [Candidatus Omnitrophica bacterium CG07_land_8_20_14_0_80_50_8]|nr:MAG: nicotinate-nucleotide diphosphorylase (carboxylating) [Candidatus Omnitrophica bacterium CG1_02_49_16]PIU39994.1 MAG: nicotinate-nucleotide diphosphorylase (carboxylating) [Candidatus Omnitrophica bacterium CG07_land_8_20_14_0_80_50_8]
MLKASLIDPLVKSALKEDVGSKDITTSALISPNLTIKAEIEFKQSAVVCGMAIAERVFRLVDENLRFLPVAKDGEWAQNGREIAYIEGSGVSILIAERTALNFISHLSGVATKTKEFVDKIKGTQAVILDTRKTTPGLRVFEKYAVLVGGGTNHRFGLYDQALVKDNHLRILRKESLVDIVARTKRTLLTTTLVGIEVKNLRELEEALKSKANYVLLDNMSVEMVREAVAHKRRIGSKIDLEVSGGVNLDNVRAYAETGVERISVGALTHAAPSIDIALDIVGS